MFGRDAMRPLLFISALGAFVPWVIALVSALMLIMALFSSLDWLFARDSDAGVTALIEYLYAAAGIGIITLVLQFREMLLKRSERRWTQRQRERLGVSQSRLTWDAGLEPPTTRPGRC